MQTGDNDRAVEEAEDQAAEDSEGVVGPVEPIGEQHRELTGDRADKDEGQEASDQHGDERRQQEVGGTGEALVQPLLNGGQNPCDAQHRDDHRLVADLVDLEAEEVPRGVGAGKGPEGISSILIGHRVGGQQGTGDHGCAHRGTQVNIAPEPLGCGEADEDGEEGEGCG